MPDSILGRVLLVDDRDDCASGISYRQPAMGSSGLWMVGLDRPHSLLFGALQ